MKTRIIGMDLSGPANPADTSVVEFIESSTVLTFVRSFSNATDPQIFEYFNNLEQTDDITVGIDAPLSYGDTGGQRVSDQELRHLLIEKGMPSGTVMAPTAPRMVYLTLRGIRLAIGIASIHYPNSITVIEVHPAGVFALRGVNPTDIRTRNSDPGTFNRFLDWLGNQGLTDLPRDMVVSAHFLDSCACALAVWKWKHQMAVWDFPAQPPLHPFRFVC
jgi:predicted nuclease with RNAse H fold